MNTKELTIYGLSANVCACEAVGLSKVWAEYAENWAGEDIDAVGFNENSGYVFIALENGMQICSMLGRDIEYIIYDVDNEDELFFNDFRQASEYLKLEKY